MFEKYRKCARCGVSAHQDPTLNFHSFPRATKPASRERIRLWAEYCFGPGTIDEDKLKDLRNSHKLLCSKHFARSAYTNSTMQTLNSNAVPTVTSQPPRDSEVSLMPVPVQDQNNMAPQNPSTNHDAVFKFNQDPEQNPELYEQTESLESFPNFEETNEDELSFQTAEEHCPESLEDDQITVIIIKQNPPQSQREFQEQPNIINVEQETTNKFDVYGKYVAVQLKSMNDEDSIIAQQEIQSILTRYKLRNINRNQS